MVFRAIKPTSFANVLVLAFPILVLCIPKGAGIFLAGVVGLALWSGHGIRTTWSEGRGVLYPLGLAILALTIVYLGSKLVFGVPWNVIDNPSRSLLALLACLVILHTAPDPRVLWRGITIALAAGFAIVAYQYFVLQEPRPAAWTQAIAFANMVAALGIIGFVRPGTDRRAHVVAWLNLALAIAILALNGTRGALLALLVTMLPLLLVRYPGLKPWRFVTAISLIGLLGIGLYLVPSSPVEQRVDQVRTEIKGFQHGDNETSVGARLKIWEIAIDSVRVHPWMGVGVGQFARVLRASEFCRQHPSPICRLEHAHNDIFEAAATMGVPGVLALLGLFFVPGMLFWRLFRTSCRNANRLGVSLSASGIGVVLASLISGLTQVTMAHQANIVFYAGIVGLLLGLAALQARHPRAGGVENL